MRSMILAIATGALVVASFGAEAMPAGSVNGASAAPQITRVIEGCGRGFMRGPGGRCVPFRRRGPVVAVRRRPAAVVVIH